MKTMNVKTRELNGGYLNYMVGMSTGKFDCIVCQRFQHSPLFAVARWKNSNTSHHSISLDYCTNYESTMKMLDDMPNISFSKIDGICTAWCGDLKTIGDTILIAAMRLIVLKHYGEFVTVPVVIVV